MSFRRTSQFLIFFLLHSVLLGQTGTIHGVVADSLTHERIPYANIVVVGQKKGTAANVHGFYFLSNIDSGSCNLSASAVGYRTTIVPVQLMPNENLELNISLPQTPVQTGEVIVTGTRRGQLSEVITSLHILSQKEMRIAPVTVQEDVFHSLQLLPGITSTSDVSSRFYVRGGAGDQNLVLLDGMKIYHPFHALGVFSIFDPDVIKSVEVFTGAFPAEFGGRLSSVVNLTSKDPRTDRYSAHVQGNFLSTKITLEGPLGKETSWLLNARKSIFSRTFSRIVQEDVPLAFYDVYFKGTLSSAGATKLDLSYLGASDRLQYEDPRSPNYTWRGDAAALMFSSLLSDRAFIYVSSYFTSFSSERESKPLLSIPPTSTKVLEAGLRASATAYSSGEDFVSFGFEFSFPTMSYEQTNVFGISRSLANTIAQLSLWTQYQGNQGPFQYTAGIHGDLTHIYYRGAIKNVLQPRLSLSYLTAEDWRLKASYGRFIQNVMTISNEDDIIPVFEAWQIIPENLPAQSADHYVFGVEGMPSEKTSLTLEAYYKYYGSLIAYNQDKIDASDPDYVSIRGESYGLEVLLRTSLDFIDLFASYTLGWTKVDNNGVVYSPRYDRRHHLNALGEFHPFENLDVSLRWEYGSGFPFTQTIGYFDQLTLKNSIPGDFQAETGLPYTLLGPKNSGRLPPYHRLDLSASYHFSFLGVRGTGGISTINLYNSQNMFYYDRSTGQRVDMIPFFPSLSLTLEY